MPITTKRHRPDDIGVAGEGAQCGGVVGVADIHNRAVLSALAVARVRPSEPNATEVTGLVWPVRVLSAVGWWGSLTSHNRAVSSALPVARMCPLGLNATRWIQPVWPVRCSGGSDGGGR